MGYILAAPAVHLAHGAVLHAAWSFGLHLVPPFLLAPGINGCKSSGIDVPAKCGAGSVALAVIGFPLVAGIDSGALAWEKSPKAAKAAATWRVVPRVDALTGRYGIELYATF